MKKIKTILMGLLITLFFAISVTSCNNSSGGSGSAPINFEWDYFPAEGDYVFTLCGTETHANDTVTISFTHETGEDTVFTVNKNGKQIYGAIPGYGFSTISFGFPVKHEQIGNLYIGYDRESNFHLTIVNREMDYNLASFTINGEDAPIKENLKTYELLGQTEVYYLDENHEEHKYYRSYPKTFHPGDSIIIKYIKPENSNFTEKYYLALYDNQDTHDIYKRGENYKDTLTYTFIDADIGRCFQERIIGIDEYDTSEVFDYFQQIKVTAATEN